MCKDRKPMYENPMTKAAGLMATCNACDRIIWQDENWREQYVQSGGYCRECAADLTAEDEAERAFFKSHPELNP